MQRLIRQSIINQSLNELSKIDEADIQHDKCPVCQYTQLKRYNGYKICPRCNNIYKLFDGKAYIVGGEINDI